MAPTTDNQPIPLHDHWYSIPTDTSLRQGDIFRALRAAWLPEDLDLSVEAGTPEDLPRGESDWIILSPTCDVAQPRVRHVLMCRVFPATRENLSANSDKEFNERMEVLRQGLSPALYLLPPHPAADPPFGYSVVEFRTQTLLPVNYVAKVATERPRLRLLHPHRERFGNWIGSRMSDVGIDDSGIIERFADAFPAQIRRAVEAVDR